MDHVDETHQMLGCHPSEFVKLPIKERQEILRRHLMMEDKDVDDDDTYNMEIAQGILLRQERFMGDDETGKQIVKEAREIYYGDNTFSVRSHRLYDFLTRDTEGDEKPMAIEPLVQRIIVRVDVRHIHDMDNFTFMPEGETEKSWVVRDLRQLLEFTNAEFIGIKVQGGGELNGSDIQTQEKINEMSGIVKKLIEQFGENFTIRKVKRRNDGQWRSRDLRSWFMQV